MAKNKATKKVIPRRAWTKEDIGQLKLLGKKKVPAIKIARVLGRTEGATRQKAFELEISLSTR